MKKITTLTLCSVALCGSVTAQNVGINTDGSAPGMMLHVKVAGGNDGIRIQNNSGTGDGIINFQDGTTDVWTLGFDASDANEFKISNSGALGTSPRFIIHESTNQIFSGFNGTQGAPAWSFNSDANTGMWRSAADELAFSAAGVELLVLDANGADQVVVNENSTDVNFRVEGNGQGNLFFTDGGNDRIGIRTGAPAFMFQMSNGGVAVGAAAMGEFNNAGGSGVGLGVQNGSAANGFATLETGANGGGSAISGIHFSGTNNSIALRGQTNSGNNNWGLFTVDNVLALGYAAISDGRLKEKVRPIETPLDQILNLRPVSYNFTQQAYDDLGINTEKLHFGFLSQEVEQVAPHLVHKNSIPVIPGSKGNPGMYADYSKAENKYSSVNYQEMIPILVGAIQEQQELIESLQEKIKTLENK